MEGRQMSSDLERLKAFRKPVTDEVERLINEARKEAQEALDLRIAQINRDGDQQLADLYARQGGLADDRYKNTNQR
jgi:hypothetical protein